MINKRFLLLNVCILLLITILISGCMENEKNNNRQTEEPDIYLTVTYDDYFANYTLEDIESLDSYSGTGGKIKTKLLPDTVEINDLHEYTGVCITTILDEISNLPDNYLIKITASDGWSSNYTKNETLGYVDVYNETGNIIQNETAVMILAYKEEGSYYSEIDPDNEIGPFRVAFVGNNVITSSSLWTKRVIAIKIISEQ